MVQLEDSLNKDTKGQVVSKKANIWEDWKHQIASTSHFYQS